MKIDKFITFLLNIDGIGDGAIRKLIICNCFKNFEPTTLSDALDFIKSHREYFSKKSQIDLLTIDDLKKANEKRKEVEVKNEALGIKTITYFSEDYPTRFKNMKDTKSCDFPVVLYYKGDISLLNSEKICSIIGTRNPSQKAIEICKATTKVMTDSGYVVVSGLAEGCDAISHKSCIDSGGKTVAIVGTGLDTVFPKCNAQLLDEILINGGLVITEYPIGFKGASYSFVQRDRLQAAGSDIVIPIQTSSNGGTMHASKACVEKYNTKLLVVSPKLVDDGDSSGNTYLIKNYFANEIESIDALDAYVKQN